MTQNVKMNTDYGPYQLVVVIVSREREWYVLIFCTVKES